MKQGVIVLLGISLAVLAGCAGGANRDPEVKAYLHKHGLAGESKANKARHASHSSRRKSKEITVDDLEL